MLRNFCVYIILTFLCWGVKTENIVSTNSPASDTLNETFLSDDTVHIWNSSNYPSAYLPLSQTLIIKCDPGYSVSVTIKDLDLDGNSGDFLVIKPGLTLEDEDKGKILTYKLKSEKVYLVHSNNAFLSLQVSGKNEVGKTGFLLHYNRVGEVRATTTEPPTTSQWPNPSEYDSVYLSVYVSGKTEEDFTTVKVQTDFQKSVSKMATEYCELNNFSLTEKITENNVHINYLTQCPFSWPERANCMKIQFSVPVFVVENSTWSGYQLTTYHLDKMWYSLGNKYLEPYGMAIYTQTANRSSLNWWIITLCITIVVFSVLLYLLKVFGANIPKYTFKKKQLNNNVIMPGYIQSNVLSMSPYSYSQSTPPIFDHDDDDYKQFEPYITVPTQNYAVHGKNEYTFSDHDSEDDIVFSNFDKKPKEKTTKTEESYT